MKLIALVKALKQMSLFPGMALKPAPSNPVVNRWQQTQTPSRASVADALALGKPVPPESVSSLPDWTNPAKVGDLIAWSQDANGEFFATPNGPFFGRVMKISGHGVEVEGWHDEMPDIKRRFFFSASTRSAYVIIERGSAEPEPRLMEGVQPDDEWRDTYHHAEELEYVHLPRARKAIQRAEAALKDKMAEHEQYLWAANEQRREGHEAQATKFQNAANLCAAEARTLRGKVVRAKDKMIRLSSEAVEVKARLDALKPGSRWNDLRIDWNTGRLRAPEAQRAVEKATLQNYLDRKRIGQKAGGWIGVDLDGTLAHYDEWKGVAHIGEPIPAMLAKVKRWLAEGKDVRIFTARVAGSDHAKGYIEEWCRKHVGRVLPVTNVKDEKMEKLYDDRATGIQRNEGVQKAVRLVVPVGAELLEKARTMQGIPGLQLISSKKNPAIKRWQQTQQDPPKLRVRGASPEPSSGPKRSGASAAAPKPLPVPKVSVPKAASLPKVKEAPATYAPPAADAPKADASPEPADTLAKFRRADGTWEPKRAELHEKIIDHFMGKVEPASPEMRTGMFMAGDKTRHDWFEHVEELVPKERVAVFLMGSPAAGKTTISNKLYGNTFVRVDPDAIKEQFPEFRREKVMVNGKEKTRVYWTDDKGEHRDARYVHEESSLISKELLARTIRKGCHFIKDGTGSNAKKMVQAIEEAKRAGYTVVLNYIRSSEALAQERNRQRERVVPEDIVHQIYRQVSHAFGRVKHAPDYVQVYESRAQGGYKLLRSEKLAKALRWLFGVRPLARLEKVMGRLLWRAE